jgi:hypothetical protein
MLEGLAAEIENLKVPLDGDGLAEAIALADRLQAKIAEAVADFDAAELYELDGASGTAAAWPPVGPATCPPWPAGCGPCR